MPRTFALATLLPIVCLGCDLQVRSFAGAVMAMTLSGATPTPAGQHLELWVRNEHDDVLRINGMFDLQNPDNPSRTERLVPYGLVIRPAITMDDPCMIDAQGHLLVSADAYPGDTHYAGVTQTP